VRVRIAGLPGEWVVLDKMPARWQRRIDLYMGRDVDAARAFGRRGVQITWTDS
jgi:3D (Asp-Asp-Asp) domain-containing protein